MNLQEECAQYGLMLRKAFTDGDRVRDENLTIPADLIIHRDIRYDEHNLLDLYLPEGTDRPLPVIVNVHGGGYVYGTKETYQYYGMFMAQQGFAFVNANYRLAPEYLFPTQLEEMVHVLQWMCTHAEKYFLDLENVFLAGDSAGAQMASQLGAIYSNPDYAASFPFEMPQGIRIRAMALNCGMYDLLALSKEPRPDTLDPMSHYVLMENYLGAEGRNREAQLDVIRNITSAYPPSYIMTSYYDFLREYAEPFYELLKEKGVDVRYKMYGEERLEYMGHVFHCNMNLEEAKACNREECGFFRAYIS